VPGGIERVRTENMCWTKVNISILPKNAAYPYNGAIGRRCARNVCKPSDPTDALRKGKLTRNRLAGIITICIGFGSLCGGLLCGFISDRLGLLKAGRFILSYYLLSLLATFIFVYYNPYYFLCFIGFMWGFSYNIF